MLGAGLPLTAEGPALRRLVCVDEDEFAARYWSKEPLLSPHASLGAGFDDLFSLEAVDHLLSCAGLRTPFVRMAKGGKVVDPARYTRSGGAGAEVADQVADDRVLALFQDGATIVLQGLHRTWPPLMALASRLAVEIGHPVQVNAYVTPPQSHGFAAHYDVHDVFVLQVSGDKRWQIHPPVIDAPLRSQPWDARAGAVAAASRAEPLIDAVLSPGDSLYLPRGFIHQAEALGGVSAHLTLGVHPVTRLAVAEAALRLLGGDDAVRASMPYGLRFDGPSGPAAVAEALASVVEALRRLPPERLADEMFGTVAAAGRPAPLAPLAQSAAIAELDDDVRLQLRPGTRCRLVPTGDGVVVNLSDRRITLPAAAGPAAALLTAGSAVRVGDLPGLAAADRLVVARRLMQEGVVVPAEVAYALPDAEGLPHRPHT